MNSIYIVIKSNDEYAEEFHGAFSNIQAARDCADWNGAFVYEIKPEDIAATFNKSTPAAVRLILQEN